MPHLLDALADEAAAAVPGGNTYTYGAFNAHAARILVVEEGGAAFPQAPSVG